VSGSKIAMARVAAFTLSALARLSRVFAMSLSSSILRQPAIPLSHSTFSLSRRCARRYHDVLQVLDPPSESITDLYRFALLLTGDPEAAGDAVVEAFAGMPEDLSQLRNEKTRAARVLREVRTRCIRKSEAPRVGDEAHDLHAFRALAAEITAQAGETPGAEIAPESVAAGPPVASLEVAHRFCLLPEPERSCLALFYLDLFTAREVAVFFKMTVEELAATLAKARKLLQKSALVPQAQQVQQ
jgi:DNA-directed RNA polymerase specialized sigma24 family protein